MGVITVGRFSSKYAGMRALWPPYAVQQQTSNDSAIGRSQWEPGHVNTDSLEGAVHDVELAGDAAA